MVVKRSVAWILLLGMLLLVGCREGFQPVGRWNSEDDSPFYFRLYEDNTCVMFNAEDEWVSSGTYTAEEDRIVFETDTGDFVWVWNGKQMVFEVGDHVTRYVWQAED